MPRSVNFKKLKRGISDQTENANSNAFKQSMISKFFLPKNIPVSEKKYEELLRSSKHDKTPQSSQKTTTENGVLNNEETPGFKNSKVEHTEGFTSESGPSHTVKKTSANTLNKLKSFSVDSDRSDESIAIRNYKEKNYSKASLKVNNSDDYMSSEPSGSEGENDSAQEQDDVEKPKNKFKRFKNSEGKYERNSNINKADVKYTPLEQQFIKIKEKNKDTILFIECGYKYRFFGKDAEIASKELNIYCHLDHNFMTASIPTHRLFVHVRRLVSKGHKVGVVKQTETAALKATSDNKSGPFSRELTALYTKSTLVGEDVNPILKSEHDDVGVDNTTPNYLMALSEMVNFDKGNKTTIGLIAVQPVTGEIIYDCFDDDITRPELECRLSHIRPVEVLLPVTTLSKETENIIKDFAEVNFNADDCIRIEKLPVDLFNYSSALKDVTSFFEEGNEDATKVDVQHILSLPVPVICSLSAILKYLKEFRLDSILKESSFNINKFSIVDSHLILNASTIRNLEIFQNLANGNEEGSLFWILDHTQTKFGSRLLRKWISQPLKDIKKIEMRQDVIEELINNSSSLTGDIRKMLKKLPDVEKGLGAIYHRKCSTAAFMCIAKALSNICQEFKGIIDQVESEFHVIELKQLFTNIVEGFQSIDKFIEIIDETAAREGDKTKLFLNLDDFPQVQKIKQEIADVISEIKDLRNSIRQTLRLPGFDYTTVSGQKFLIEVRNSQLKAVPNTWTKISCTKQVVRFRSPEVEALVTKLKQLEEQLVLSCNEAWNIYLNKFNKHYRHYKQAIQEIGLLDCFLSLAEVAKQHGYTRPLFVEHSTVIQIEQGYHPIVPVLFKEEEQYVPNNTDLDINAKHCMIITGPNMGGKSSYIRQVALICIMAQIGSFVPANIATLSILDGVYTRMGASDEIYQGRSTFMVELQEASQIMQQATSRSLVILDELGRGTSTHDGVAIAYASLNYFVNEVKCLVLFVTHYPELTEFEKLYPDYVRNFHMNFLINETDSDANDDEKITFLYQLVEGTADCSYGLNVARLADIPKEILQKASQKSQQMGAANNKKRSINNLFKKAWTISPSCLVDLLEI